MISRRTGLTATAVALLAGAAGPAAAAARQAPAPPAAARPARPTNPAARHRLQIDADAIMTTGATGVVAEVQNARGRRTASSGTADLSDPGTPVPPNASYRIGSDTKTFTAVLALQLIGGR
jgi:D-alanyl-D-alanine carboxypeptidase